MKEIKSQKSTRTRRKSRLTSQFKLTFVLTCLVTILVTTILSPVFAVNDIVVEGAKYVKSEEIIKSLPFTKGRNLFMIRGKEVVQTLEKNPYIESAKIHRRPLHTFVISVEERKPVALVSTGNGSFVVSDEGYFLQVAEEGKNFNLPIISGTGIKKVPKPDESPIEDEKLQVALKLINDNATDVAQLIQEINVSDLHNILLYTTQGIEVRFGDVDKSTERIKKLLDIIEQVVLPRSLDGQIEYVDMRYINGPVIKMRTGNETLKSVDLPLGE